MNKKNKNFMFYLKKKKKFKCYKKIQYFKRKMLYSQHFHNTFITSPKWYVTNSCYG